MSTKFTSDTNSASPLWSASSEGLGSAANVPALPLETLANCARMVRAFGCSAAQAAAAFDEFGKAVNKLEDEETWQIFLIPDSRRTKAPDT